MRQVSNQPIMQATAQGTRATLAALSSDRRVRNTAPVQGGQQLGDAVHGRIRRAVDERRSRFDRLDQKRPELLVERDNRGRVNGSTGVERGRLEREPRAVVDVPHSTPAASSWQYLRCRRIRRSRALASTTQENSGWLR